MTPVASNESGRPPGASRARWLVERARWWLVIAVAMVLVLSVRLGGFGFLSGANLWAEDGTIFFREAFHFGWKSLFQPYAGYLHLFQRMVALAASFFPLSWLPVFYNGGWLAGFAGLGFLVFRLFRRQAIPVGWGIPAMIGIVILPVYPEIYFSLTNVQWLLGIAVTLLVLFSGPLGLGWPRLLLVGFLGLTGPFCIPLLPVFLLRAAVARFRGVDWWLGGVLAFCAVIQLGFMAVSERSGGGGELGWVPLWRAVATFFAMGLPGWAGWLGVLYFLALGVLAVRDCRRSGLASNGTWILFAGALFFGSGVWASIDFLDSLSPVGWGGRYFFIPYGLSLLAIFWLSRSNVTRGTLVAWLFLISAIQFKPVQRPELHFQSFAWLASHRSEVLIPIHPQWENFPSWHLPVVGNANSQSVGHRIPPEELTLRGGRFGEGMEVIPEDGLVEIWLEIPGDLRNTPHLGVDLVVVRAASGWSSVSLHRAKDAPATSGFRRYYWGGWALMRHALPYDGERWMRIVPIEAGGAFRLEWIELISEGFRDRSE